MVVVTACRIEGGVADRAARLHFQIFANRQPCATGPTENCFLVPFAARPSFDGMAGKRDVAVFAGIVDTAALHFDGDDVRRFMVVQTTRVGIQMQSSDLWSYWMDGRAGILFLFS
jgi:hypothetical protein